MNQSVSQIIIRNTIFNASGKFIGIIVSFFITPYVVGHLGVERFGIWAIVGVLTGYLGLLDFGIGTSFIKYISEFFTKRDFKKINELINTGFVFYSILAATIIVLGFFVTKPLLKFFSIPEAIQAEASFVFLVGIVLFNISNALSPFNAILEGLQRMDMSNKVNIVMAIPNVLGTILFLENGYGLPGLMINNLINFTVMSVIKIILAFRILPEIRFDPFLFNGEMFNKLFRFGYKLQFSRLAYLVAFQTDKLLITYFLGISYVTFYQLGATILQRAREIPLLMVSALVPAVSELEANHGQRVLTELYLRGSKYLIFVSTPLLFFLITNASLIMFAWMGSGYERAALVIQVLAIGYFAATVSGVASQVAVGVAKTEFEMRYGILIVPLNLILSYILIMKIGFVGAVAGTSLSLVVGALFFIRMFQKYLNTNMLCFAKLFYKPVFISVASSLVMLFLNYNLWPVNEFMNRALHLIILFINCLVFTGIYLFFIRLSKYFDNYDSILLKDRIPLGGYIFRSATTGGK